MISKQVAVLENNVLSQSADKHLVTIDLWLTENKNTYAPWKATYN